MTSGADVIEERLRQTLHEVATSSVVAGATHHETVPYSSPNGGAFPWQFRATSIAFVLALVIAAIVLVFAVGPFRAKNHSVPVSVVNTARGAIRSRLQPDENSTELRAQRAWLAADGHPV